MPPVVSDVEAPPRGADAVLLDGTTVAVRPVAPADEPALARLLDGLSVRSRWLRFFSGAADLIGAGVRSGEFATDDPLGAALHILVNVDGLGSYTNDDALFDHPALHDMAIGTAERVLGLPTGTLRGRG